MENAELKRLQEPFQGPIKPWQKWGPYVADRAWGTVREDYSDDGEAWDYLTYDKAMAKAYRWGEDAIAGWCDRYQLMVFGLSFWNGNDATLKERYFGLRPSQANHGEDVKELYYYLDNTPTHSYMKFLYKYPHAAFPYEKLIEENKKRNSHESEYELIDTGIFDENRYFDIQVEYAKIDAEDVCVKIEVFNRGPEDHPIHLIPQLWFRNTWGWKTEREPEPTITKLVEKKDCVTLVADDSKMRPMSNINFEYKLGKRYLYGPLGGTALFTDNETNLSVVHGTKAPSASPFTKEAFHTHIIKNELSTNPACFGTKACIHYPNLMVKAGSSITLHLRLSDKHLDKPLEEVEKWIDLRKKEADVFYSYIQPAKTTDEEKMIQRQALSGLLWSKMVYLFDVDTWLEGDNPKWPPSPAREEIRNKHWRHLNSMRIMSMPDKWEYPWFAAWDLAFQSIAMALVDIEFAKEQLWLLLFEQFLHPNGQVPAYEWEFSDLNPPIFAWAVLKLYEIEKNRWGKVDWLFIERCFHKLMLNFTWWVNRTDSSGNNVFEGGFLGLDNITVFDRSQKLGNATLKQSDATGWIGMFCLNLMRLALTLSNNNPAYEHLATKFFEHYVIVGAAMKKAGGKDYELWSEKDGFFYDVLCYHDGSFHQFQVRSLVGIIPIFAVEILLDEKLKDMPSFYGSMTWFLKNRLTLSQACVTQIESKELMHLLTIMNPKQIQRLLSRVWDEEEFLSPFGLRSLSKYHQNHPFVFQQTKLSYEPAESVEKIKGGNSNWRGPIWFPLTFMLIDALEKLYKALGDDFKVKTKEGELTLDQIACGFSDRLLNVFKRDENGRRPVFGDVEKFQKDPHFKDHLLFYEYFNGENGKGLGASHQTGWTALVANLINMIANKRESKDKTDTF